MAWCSAVEDRQRQKDDVVCREEGVCGSASVGESLLHKASSKRVAIAWP
jgi:hypothetical protein